MTPTPFKCFKNIHEALFPLIQQEMSCFHKKDDNKLGFQNTMEHKIPYYIGVSHSFLQYTIRHGVLILIFRYCWRCTIINDIIQNLLFFIVSRQSDISVVIMIQNQFWEIFSKCKYMHANDKSRNSINVFVWKHKCHFITLSRNIYQHLNILCYFHWSNLISFSISQAKEYYLCINTLRILVSIMRIFITKATQFDVTNDAGLCNHHLVQSSIIWIDVWYEAACLSYYLPD